MKHAQLVYTILNYIELDNLDKIHENELGKIIEVIADIHLSYEEIYQHFFTLAPMPVLRTIIPENA